MKQCNGLIIILDGLGDRPIPGLDGATPLEAAHTPNMDELVSRGRCGLVDPLYPGVPVSTHTGAGVLFGINTRDAFLLPRGPVEAAGTGLPIMPGDIALRCNFATLRVGADGLEVMDRRAGRIHADTGELAEALQDITLEDGFSASVRPATGHRAVMRLSGPGPLPVVSDTDPGSGALPGRVLTCHTLDTDNPLGEQTANAINAFIRHAYERLNEHPVNRERVQQGLLPANGIITRGAGSISKIHNIIHHIGLSTALVAGERTITGLAQLSNFAVISRPEFTSMADTSLESKVSATLAALQDHDLVYLHVKAPDIFSHDRDPQGKKAFLEKVDAALAPLLQQDIVIGLSADHSTDSNTGRHCGDPVPSFICAPNGRRDQCREFGETHCIMGGLGRIPARALLLTVLDEMGRMQNYRTMDSPYFI
jgi:2,3-bisphosphoglycerate-independent phosphoglycerate mutase